jgi:hypothetical protein
MRFALCGAAVLASACTFAPAQSTEDRLKQLDDEVRQLRQEVARLKQNGATTKSADDTAAILREIDEDTTRRSSLPRKPADLNPRIAVIGDFRASASTNNDNPARNRFDMAAVELDLRAAVAPIADAVVILPIFREVHDPLFPEDDPEAEVESGIELEEAYLFFHDFGVPNLTAKLGRFHLRFGRQNILHAHDLPTVDNNFVNQSFLGPEAISDAGLSLSYVIPPRLLGNHYVELIAEIISGEGDEEAPVVNNSAAIDSPAVNLHALWNHNIAENWNLELGASALFAKRNDDNSQDARLFGLDATLIRRDPTGRFNNQMFQAEAIYGDVDTDDTTQHAFGAYVLAQQQLNRDWYLGCRLDWTENAVEDTQETWGISPYVSWYYFEFLRFRLEYQHKAGDVPPHPYWAMR